MNAADIEQIRAFVSSTRLVEWWALLNAFERPAEMSSDLNDSIVFRWLCSEVPQAERMTFWNGAFRCGREPRAFIQPQQ